MVLFEFQTMLVVLDILLDFHRILQRCRMPQCLLLEFYKYSRCHALLQFRAGQVAGCALLEL